MFNKIVAVEPINILEHQKSKLWELSKDVILHDTMPIDNNELIMRINDADCVLVSYTTIISKEVISKCPNIKYIGMCCSLYSKESANVDIKYCEEHGIVVTGVRDYGDNGVIEYIIHELVEFLQGYKKLRWHDLPLEIEGLKCGIIGLGTSGTMIAKALKFFGANVSYYSRTRKEHLEKELNITYLALNDICRNCDAIFLALNKNVLLLQKEQFDLMSGKRILFNTSIGPGFDPIALTDWLKDQNHYFFGDTLNTAGNLDIWQLDNTFTINRSSGGFTYQAFERLGNKVLNNIIDFLRKNE